MLLHQELPLCHGVTSVESIAIFDRFRHTCSCCLLIPSSNHLPPCCLASPVDGTNHHKSTLPTALVPEFCFTSALIAFRCNTSLEFPYRRNLHRRLLSLPAAIFIPTTSIFTTYAPPSQPHDNSPQTTNPPRHCSSSNTKTISLTQPPPSSGLIAYSEGTRLTPSRHAAAAAFCERAGKPPPSPYTLVPRPRGFIATVNALRGTPHVRAVLDVTIAYARGREFMRAPPFWETVASGNLRGDGYRFYAHVDRWEMDGLPTGEEELAKWLDERWVEKGKRLERLKTQLENGEEWEGDGSVSKKDS